MNEKIQTTADAQAETLTGPGAQLRLAREASRLSVNDIARYLHLKPEVIISIENDDYSRAPRAVFIRGYIRSYAKLLQLPADEFIASLERYYQEEEPELVPETGAKTEQFFLDPQQLRWALLAFVGVILLITMRSWYRSAEETKPTSPVPLVAKSKHPPAVKTPMVTATLDTSAADATPTVSPVKPKKPARVARQVIEIRPMLSEAESDADIDADE